VDPKPKAKIAINQQSQSVDAFKADAVWASLSLLIRPTSCSVAEKISNNRRRGEYRLATAYKSTIGSSD
jgi:hypothetical protein